MTVPDCWWPVVELKTPDEYSGPAAPNPLILEGGAAAPEIQVILQLPGGWLDVLENFRGDLGDVSGRPAGSVVGHTATLYEVNEGWLVQWSDRGRWYGVFGRGLPAETVVESALNMILIPVEGAP
jgi:hypothetical protein